MRLRRQRTNPIWLAAGIMLTILLSIQSIRGNIVSSMALEQEARCGSEEHIHTAECLKNGVRNCGKTAHTHNRNCYLVLLRENNVNHLLTQMDSTGSHSLERLIYHAVGNVYYSEGPGRPGASASASAAASAILLGSSADISSESIAELNAAISQSSQSASQSGRADAEPVSLVLNENLFDATELTDSPGDTVALLSPVVTTEPSVSPLSIGDGSEPSTSTGQANFYVQLDTPGNWVLIGTTSFTVTQRYNGDYRAQLSSGTAVTTFINENLGSSYSRSQLALRWANSQNASQWNNMSNWTNQTARFKDFDSQAEAQAAKYVRIYNSSGNPLTYYTVVLDYPEGMTDQTVYIPAGGQVTLPGPYQWQDSNGRTYTGGAEVTVNGPMTFAATLTGVQLNVTYNVAFPTVSGVTIGTRPTIQGMSATTHTDSVDAGDPLVIRNVSEQEVKGSVNGNTTGLSRIVRFRGWKVGDTDVLLSANATITGEELLRYVDDNGNLTLTAQWDSRAVQTASFYIRYDSVAVDTNGNITSQDSNLYTPELFATHVGGDDPRNIDNTTTLNNRHYIADTTSDNSFGADQAIRALHGEQDGVWLQSFPTDDYIFSLLTEYAKNLRVDGQPVAVEDLNDNAYTIRWYVFKSQSDAWHIDGRLVKKEGVMHVTKTFAGNRAGVLEAKERNFQLTAVNGSGTKRHTLTLDNAKSYNAATDTYLWEIKGAEYGEDWVIRENTEAAFTADGVTYNVYSAYRVVDPVNDQNNNQSGEGTEVSFKGQTYAMDADNVEVMNVAFSNVYHTIDSIIIKKEDAKTGNPIGGATFRLLQNGYVMQFRYDAATDRYIYDPAGSSAALAGSASGYYEIVTTGFTYDDGPVTVQEMVAPAGYTLVGNIVIGRTGNNDEIGIIGDMPMASYHNGLLIVQNSTENTSVTAVKEWNCPEAEWRPVTVQLLANGTLASLVIPEVTAEAKLTTENSWSYTWGNLPTHVDGVQIQWSLREIQVGTEVCRPDYSFANWIVSYGAPVYTTDGQGRITNTRLTVLNTTQRTMLVLVKSDSRNASIRIGGVQFRLEHMIQNSRGEYIVNPDFVVRTLTTDANGIAQFDNLLFGRYRLTELNTPPGYEEMTQPIYLNLQTGGLVTVDAHPYAAAGATAYSIQVYNQPGIVLPATGGGGFGWFIALGVLMMLTALSGGYLPRRYKPKRVRGRDPTG